MDMGVDTVCVWMKYISNVVDDLAYILTDTSIILWQKHDKNVLLFFLNKSVVALRYSRNACAVVHE